MGSAVGKAFDYLILKRLFFYIKPYRKIFIIAVFLTISLALISPLRPLLIQFTFDKHIALGDSRGLLNMTVLMFILLLIQCLLQYYHTYVTNWLGQSVVKDLRIELYTHINNFKVQYFDNTPIGTIITRTISDIETIADIFSEGLIVIVGDILQLIAIVAVMFFIDWRLTLVSLSAIPILLIATNTFKNGIRQTFKEVRTQVALLNTFVQEHITGMSIVQIFGREEVEMKKFMEINELHKKAHVRSVWYYSVFFPVVEVLSAASLGLLVWWGAKGVVNEYVSLGDLIAFILYILMLFRPIRELADKFNTLQMGVVSSERIFAVLDTNLKVENKGMHLGDSIKGNIAFQNVWFAYKKEDWVLKDISFELGAGETLAIVGATGAGKTSIINILNRFYEINQGVITIDGINIKDYELSELRRYIAIVLQDVFLFSDTIANNISFKNNKISQEQIVEAARVVGANKFIERLPGAYDYNVRERGAMLSTGQRQLISFIRAYVHDPKILILDEATSSIDSESEELIQKATYKLTKNRTSIVIAHRLSTIQKADKIMVMDHGEIREMGTHSELLKLGKLYKKLYERQFQNGKD